MVDMKTLRFTSGTVIAVLGLWLFIHTVGLIETAALVFIICGISLAEHEL